LELVRPCPEGLRNEVSQIIIHKADEPDVIVNFFDADGLAGKDLAKIVFFGGPNRYGRN
jgi:hypothetical protein